MQESSTNDQDFINWLKHRKCPDEIIDLILNENSRWHYRSLEEHIRKQPELFTALLENGYEYKAIEHLFLYNNHDELIKQKDIAIELIKNKCDYNNIQCMSHFHDSKKFFNHKDFYIELCKNVPPTPWLIAQDILKFFAAGSDENKLKKCIRNKGLTDLIIKNLLKSRIINKLLERDDYETLSINNNKELLDLLLKDKLIFSDDNFPNDKDRKDLVTKDSLISSLLKAGKLKISDLLGLSAVTESTTVGIKAKVKELTENRLKEVRTQSTLSSSNDAKAPGLIGQVMKKLEYNQNGVQSLTMLSVNAALKTPLAILESPQVEEVKATQEIASRRCNIM